MVGKIRMIYFWTFNVMLKSPELTILKVILIINNNPYYQLIFLN